MKKKWSLFAWRDVMNSEFENYEQFSWADFEKLDEFCVDSDPQEGIEISDSSYRQIRMLNEALVNKAGELERREQELEKLISEFQQQKHQFDAKRVENIRPGAESRLERIISAEKGTALSTNQKPKLEIATVQTQSPPEAEIDFQEIIEGSEKRQAPNPIQPIAPLVATDEEKPVATHDVSRLQQSVATLRQKSEFISAVFVEMDQMVRDLSHQQELLEKIQINQNAHSANEFQLVSDKVKRRFRRISKQINLQ